VIITNNKLIKLPDGLNTYSRICQSQKHELCIITLIISLSMPQCRYLIPSYYLHIIITTFDLCHITEKFKGIIILIIANTIKLSQNNVH